MNDSANYNQLILKLDAFIRKYYSNQVIRGSIYTIAAVLIFYLSIALLEHFAWFGTAARSFLFYSFLFAASFVFTKLVLVSVFKMYRLGKIISYEQASEIIGNHFPNISDKLLNTLQLKNQSGKSNLNFDLINASVEQKTAELRPVPFSSAIDLRKNKKYIPYAAVPLAVFLILLFAAPNLIKDSTNRLIHPNITFEKPAPFSFIILNKELKVVQQKSFMLNVKIEGSEIPDNVYLHAGNNKYKMEKEGKINFNYTFENVNRSTPFTLFASGYESKEFLLEAVPNPIILNFEIALTYPAYLQKKNETLRNTGDLIIPAGTHITWKFKTQNTDVLSLSFADTTIRLQNDENTFSFSKTLLKNNSYAVSTSNAQLTGRDSMLYSITVIPDLYPSIQAEEQRDSNSSQRIYFRGLIKDDYGFSKLAFCYRFLSQNDSLKRDKNVHTQLLPLNKSLSQQEFFHYWDASALNIQPGEEMEYYFEVWDNDGVTGAKSARSQSQLFKAPTLRELAENTEKSNDEIKKDLIESIKEAKKLQKQINEAAKKLLEKKKTDYEDKKKIEDLLKEHKALEEKVKDIQKQQEQNQSKQNEYKTQDSQIAEKQQQLQQLFDKLMSDEMKELMKQLEQLMAQLDKQKIQEQLEKMKLGEKDLEKQLDRTLELFKQLEVEKKMKDAIENLDKLAEEQKNLAEQTEQKNADNKELLEKQKELGSKFDEIKKDLKELEKKNQQLEFPQELANTEEEQKEIDKEQQSSEQQLGENKKSNASKSQKNAGQKMEQMSSKMKNQMAQNQEEQQEEDMQSLRYLLENLIRFSLDQEALMQNLKSIDVNNPQYVSAGKTQRKLSDDFKIIQDSLFALSKRVMQIQNTVTTEVNSINSNIEKSVEQMEDRQVPMARSSQQYVMTSANNLALLLNEALEQMQQQQMQSQQMKSGNCKKPGQGKPGPSAKKLKQMQQQLSEQMKGMKQKLDQGKKPGGKKGQGQDGMSEELARMAAQQEAIRNELNQLNQQENKDGKGSMGNLGKTADQMEQNERDIVNKKITEETLKRQQEILTRLLEAENAEREREQDQQRKAEQAKQEFTRNPSAFEEYKKLKSKETELLKTVPPELNPFYKNLVNVYFQNLNKVE